MSGFDLSGYVDVAERISIFHEKYPEGSLQSHVDFVEGGVLCVAEAYRTPDDIRPGVGHAFEPIPGKTPYTRDSEVMNAETSAWGRAIVALGFETKKIASKQELVNRQELEAKDGPDDPLGPEKQQQVEQYATSAGFDFWEVAEEMDLGPELTNGEARRVCEEIAKRKKAK